MSSGHALSPVGLHGHPAAAEAPAATPPAPTAALALLRVFEGSFVLGQTYCSSEKVLLKNNDSNPLRCSPLRGEVQRAAGTA